ncbi:MAG: J domain-containing protein [Vicinamibacterales bacterium]
MPTARTHYELMSIDPSADDAGIKTAFREQIARYHPDKVVHLGQEFQELAAERTAELTAAYTTLIDPALRRQYDESLRVRQVVRHDSGADPARFSAERAGGDGIVQRALIGRVRNAVIDLYGAVDSPRVRGFDLTLVPTTSPPLMRSPFPRVFVKLRDVADAAQVREACAEAARAGLHVPGSPINVLLFGKRLSDEPQILMACDNVRNQRRAGVPEKTFAVVIDAADWRALFASSAPPALRRFIDRLRT